MNKKLSLISSVAGTLFLLFIIIVACKKGSSPNNPPVVNPPVVNQPTDMMLYLTRADQTVLFQKQNISLLFAAGTPSFPVIDVDTAQTYQTIDGFGYTLTGGSATLINSLSASLKDDLLKNLCSWDSTNIGVSYLRISVGASDLSSTSFTYDD